VTALVFSEKLGVLPERIFESMFNDRLVAKGTILLMVTEIFKQYMAVMSGGADDLVALLAKAKVSNRLLEYFPPGQQTEEAFRKHFEAEGLHKLVHPYFAVFLIRKRFLSRELTPLPPKCADLGHYACLPRFLRTRLHAHTPPRFCTSIALSGTAIIIPSHFIAFDARESCAETSLSRIRLC
jgi:hypothetical protein